MPTNGSTLPSVSSHGDTGVAISISRLPRSRSRTSAMAVNSTIVIVEDHADEARHRVQRRAPLRVVEVHDLDRRVALRPALLP